MFNLYGHTDDSQFYQVAIKWYVLSSEAEAWSFLLNLSGLSNTFCDVMCLKISLSVVPIAHLFRHSSFLICLAVSVCGCSCQDTFFASVPFLLF